jgi:tRNA(fMet)-specific endonuclease VapC
MRWVAWVDTIQPLILTDEERADMERYRAEHRRFNIEMQIGAVARTLPNCTVVSKDADLSAISGITVENWAS